MSGEQRFLMALEMSLFARELAKERIRAEHPEWTHSRVALELVRLALLPAPTQIPRLQPGGVRPSPISQRAGPSSFCGERRGCSHCETGMVKAGAIATANRRCGGHIEVTMGNAGPVLPGKMDFRVRLETGME